MKDSVMVNFRPVDKIWDKEILQYAFDIYHLSGWLTASATIDKGIPKGIVAEYKNKKMFCPIIIRDVDDKYWDATSTYGYSGPIIDASLTFNDIDVMLEQIKRFLLENNCISWFIRLHPIINKEWHTNIGETVTHGSTIMTDLTKSEAEHWGETKRRHRRGIKKALSMGVTSKIENLSEENIPIFSKIYKETMQNVSASEYYFFDDSYFYALSKHLQDRLLLITAYKEDTAIAALLCTNCKETGIMQFHLGGTLDEYRDLEPYKLITHIARDWGRENGYKVLHFGGGVGAKQDSVYDYKIGFSPKQLDFKSHRIIVNSQKYNELVAKSFATRKIPDTDFFPLYRKST